LEEPELNTTRFRANGVAEESSPVSFQETGRRLSVVQKTETLFAMISSRTKLVLGFKVPTVTKLTPCALPIDNIQIYSSLGLMTQW
jgi:hypothetical protein